MKNESNAPFFLEEEKKEPLENKLNDSDSSWEMVRKQSLLREINEIKYTVQVNDSLNKISFLTGLSKKQIKSLNNLPNDHIVPGQILKLPAIVPQTQKKHAKKSIIKYLNPFRRKKKNQVEERSSSQHFRSGNDLPRQKRPMSTQVGHVKGNLLEVSQVEVNRDKNREPSPRTRGLIDRIFATYKDVKKNNLNELQAFNFDINDYIIQNTKYPDYFSNDEFEFGILDSSHDFWVKTKCYYMTGEGKIHGHMVLKKETLEFISMDSGVDTEKLKQLDRWMFEDEIKKAEKQDKNRISGTIYYQDIKDLTILCLENMSEEENQNDFHLMVSLKAVNGVGVISDKDSFIEEETKTSIPGDTAVATIYFKFHHADGYDRILPQNNEQEVITKIKAQIMQMIEKNRVQKYQSRTFVPYFDNMELNKEQKSKLSAVTIEGMTLCLLQNFNLQRNMDKYTGVALECKNCNNCIECNRLRNDVVLGFQNNDNNNKIIQKMKQKEQTQIQPTNVLLEFQPITGPKKSSILSDLQISNFVSCLPQFYRFCEWERLYKLDEDGCSLLTFYNQVREYENTIIIVQDEYGKIFGGFQTENWVPKYKFYGNGTNFIFAFQSDNEFPDIYQYTGDGEQFMYSDDDCIGLGGSAVQGRFGLFLSNNFGKGYSMETTIFNNDLLSRNNDFVPCKIEVWGIVD